MSEQPITNEDLQNLLSSFPALKTQKSAGAKQSVRKSRGSTRGSTNQNGRNAVRNGTRNARNARNAHNAEPTNQNKEKTILM